MRKRMGMAIAFLLTALVVAAQKRPVHGRIVDDGGRPVSGATVQIKGLQDGVVTNDGGNFIITASPTDVLVISYVGYRTLEVRADNVQQLVLVQEGKSVDSVLITTALGIRRTRNSLSYSAQLVSGSDLNRTAGTDFLNNLSGKVAGLQVTESNALGGSANIILRGVKSLTQTNQALVVVDGIPFDNSPQNLGGYDLGNPASDINPDEIESVTVLKGAAASALYGSRASNGVIVISTRRGIRQGRSVRASIGQTVQVGTFDKSTLPKYQTQYGQGYGSAGATSPDGYFYYQPAVGSGGLPVSIVETDEDQVWGSAFNPGLKVYQWDAFSPGNPNFGKATPWVSAPHHDPTDFLVTPVTSITNINVSAANELSSLDAAYSNSYDKGALPNSDIKRNTLHLGATYKLADRLTIGGGIDYSDENGLNRSSYDFRAVNTALRDFRQWWPTNVDVAEQKADYLRSHTNNTWNWLGGYLTAGPGDLPPAAYHNNAYFNQYENYNDDNRERYFGNISLNYQVLDNLSILARVSKDSYDQLFETRVAVGSFQTPSYSKYLGSYGETNYDLLANYNVRLSRDFGLKALLGGNVRQDVNSSTSAATSGGLVVPDFYALSNSVKTPPAPTEYYAEKEVDGVFAGATLSYKEWLTLDATLRRDQSSTLPKGNNAYYYPAVSGNFLFSKLLPDWNWLSYGKLRANYAEVGGDAPAYSTRNTFVAGTPFNNQTLFTYTTTNNNPDLLPERNKSYEAGVEAAFLHNRLGFDVTLYRSRLVNQITPITPSAASGFTLFYVNGGTLQNQGVEVSLNATPVRTRDFSWTILLNWSKNQNKVLSLYGGQSSYTIANYQNAIQLVAEVGKSTGILRGTDYQYVNGQRLIGADGYPIKANNTKSDIGDIDPQWLGGVTNSLQYKGFTFSFLVDVREGGDVYSLDQDYGAWSGVYPETAGKNSLGNSIRTPVSQGGGLVLSGLTANKEPNTTRVDISDINTAQKFPFGSVNNIAAKSYVYDASYIKLREVALAWSLPSGLFSGKHVVKGIDLSLTGRNLWIIHKNLPYADPEQGSASTTTSSSAPIVYNPNASIGYQTGVYPSVRSFAFNVKLKF